MLRPKRKIGIIPGDGIGIDVSREAVHVLEFITSRCSLDLELVHFDFGAEKYLATGISLPKEQLEDFRQNYAAIFLGALGDPRIPDMAHARDILFGMRFGLDRIMGVSNIVGKALISNTFELSLEILRHALLGSNGRASFESEISIPPRPPVLCPGCPHSGVYFALHKLKAVVTGDIGCYTLGALYPFNALDTTFCMGAGIANAFGMEKVHRATMGKKLVAVIGDSTFLHSGIAPLIDIVFNKGVSTVILMDNSTTGMTGHQQHPGMGKTVKNVDTYAINYEELIHAIGVKHVSVIDPYDLTATERAIKEAMNCGEPSVVISRRPCVLLPEEKAKTHVPYEVVDELCEECDLCLKIGCPAIGGLDPIPHISKERCIGCDLCAKLCAFHAIRPIGARDYVA